MLGGNSSESVDSTGCSANAYPENFSRVTEYLLLPFTDTSNLEQLSNINKLLYVIVLYLKKKKM